MSSEVFALLLSVRVCVKLIEFTDEITGAWNFFLCFPLPSGERSGLPSKEQK